MSDGKWKLWNKMAFRGKYNKDKNSEEKKSLVIIKRK